MTKRILIIAPHPDDEVLGVGGTIARCARAGDEVTVVVCTRGVPPLFPEESTARLRAEMAEAHRILGVSQTVQLDLPAAQIDTVPHHEVNRELARTLDEFDPDVVFLPNASDIHLDHQLVHLSAMVALRPSGRPGGREILAYETVSETHWNTPHQSPPFVPTCWYDITETLSAKLDAFRAFKSQVMSAPHERSLENLEALARVRGATVGLAAAEAFATVRLVR